MNERLNIINENGEEIEAEILLYFNLDSTGKDYVLYTIGEVDENQMETIHASILEKTDAGYKLDTMPEDDWETVKEIMREIIRNEEE